MRRLRNSDMIVCICRRMTGRVQVMTLMKMVIITCAMSSSEECGRLASNRSETLKENHEPTDVPKNAMQESLANSRQKMKPHCNELNVNGYKVDEQGRVVCLDCGRIFSRKSCYNIHNRMFVVTLSFCFCWKYCIYQT